MTAGARRVGVRLAAIALALGAAITACSAPPDRPVRWRALDGPGRAFSAQVPEGGRAFSTLAPDPAMAGLLVLDGDRPVVSIMVSRTALGGALGLPVDDRPLIRFSDVVHAARDVVGSVLSDREGCRFVQTRPLERSPYYGFVDSWEACPGGWQRARLTVVTSDRRVLVEIDVFRRAAARETAVEILSRLELRPDRIPLTVVAEHVEPLD